MATKKEIQAAKLIDEYLAAKLSGRSAEPDAYLDRCPSDVREEVRLALEGADFLVSSYKSLLLKSGGVETVHRRIEQLIARQGRLRAMQARLGEADLPSRTIEASAILDFLSQITGISVSSETVRASKAAPVPAILYRSKTERGPARETLEAVKGTALVSNAEQVAYDFVREVNLGDVPIDPYEVAKAHSILVIERQSEGCDGCLLVEGETAAILVNAGIRVPERRRFTLAHELGHFALHRETIRFRRESLAEIEREFDMGLEAEANAFASELLMPAESVDREFSRREPSFSVVDLMREHYRVSTTAAALRLTKRSHHACALVCIRDATIAWVAKSPEWREYYIPVGMPLHRYTVSAAILAREHVPQRAERVAASYWAPEHRYDEESELMEEARAIYDDCVLTLLYDREAG